MIFICQTRKFLDCSHQLTETMDLHTTFCQVFFVDGERLNVDVFKCQNILPTLEINSYVIDGPSSKPNWSDTRAP